MKKIYFLLAMVLVMTGFTSCDDVEYLSAEPVAKVSSLDLTTEGRDVTLTWTLPDVQGVRGVVIQDTNEATDTVDAPTTSYTYERVAMNKELVYTVKVVYDNGRVSEGETVRTTIEGVAGRVGMLIGYNSASEVEDDDEKAAVEWFQKAYPDGVILTPSSILTANLTEYAAIWIQIDREGIQPGWRNLPSALIGDDVIGKLTEFYKDGGCLLLGTHATQLIVPLGRLAENRAPGLFGSGSAIDSPEPITINANIGNGVYDHRSHRIFSGLSVSSIYAYETYPLIGVGVREDHNCMWDLNSYGLGGLYPDAPDTVYAFEQENDAVVLATWGHVVDYCCAGIVEFEPSGDYAGRCIAIGVACYEWNQNSGPNEFQSNIELLTSNCLNYFVDLY